jgi:hypothetical protein
MHVAVVMDAGLSYVIGARAMIIEFEDAVHAVRGQIRCHRL